MSLPSIQGRGFLISDGIELKFSKTGNAYARLPLSFRNARKGEDGNWTYDKEILVEGVVFGALAESLSEVVSGRTDLNVVGQLYTEEYEGKLQVKMMVQAAWPLKEEKPDRAPSHSGAGQPEKNYPF